MKQNKTTILKQCTQLIWSSLWLTIIILTLMPVTDTNNNGESCIYVSNYDSVYQWFFNDMPCMFTLSTYITSYIILFVLYWFVCFIIKMLKYIYQKISNKTFSINTKQSIFKLFILQAIELILGYWIYLIYITAIHTTLSVSILFLTFTGTLIYILPLMLIICFFDLFKIFYQK